MSILFDFAISNLDGLWSRESNWLDSPRDLRLRRKNAIPLRKLGGERRALYLILSKSNAAPGRDPWHLWTQGLPLKWLKLRHRGATLRKVKTACAISAFTALFHMFTKGSTVVSLSNWLGDWAAVLADWATFCAKALAQGSIIPPSFFNPDECF